MNIKQKDIFKLKGFTVRRINEGRIHVQGPNFLHELTKRDPEEYTFFSFAEAILNSNLQPQQQETLMKFDPGDCNGEPYPSHAKQYREWHGKRAWIYDPWTGKARREEDIGTDHFGFLIIPENEAIYG